MTEAGRRRKGVNFHKCLRQILIFNHLFQVPDTSEKLAGAIIGYMNRPPQESAKPAQPSDATAPPRKTAGVLFGELVAEVYDEIPKGYNKDMIKIDVIKMLYDAKYKAVENSVPSSSYSTPIQVQGRSTRIPPPSPVASTSSLSSPEGNQQMHFRVGQQPSQHRFRYGPAPPYNPLLQLSGQDVNVDFSL